MPLVTSQGFDLNPRIGQGLARGIQTLGQFQLMGQRNLQAQREAGVREALSGATQMQPQTEQQQMLAEQTEGLGGALAQAEQPQPIMTHEEKIQLARDIDPAIANKILKEGGLDDASKRAEASRFAAQLEQVPFDQRRPIIEERIQNLESRGRDATQSRQLLDMDEQTQNQGLLGVQLADLNTKERFDVKGRAARQRAGVTKAFAPVTLIDPITKEKILVSPTVDNLTGKAKLSPFDIPAGFELSTETSEEKRAANVLASGQKESQKITAKGKAARQQQSIGRGLDSAEGMANVQRGLDLLDKVATGGVDALSIRIKQSLGLEGADEAELSNRLSKAVLSQLKATFGAAFTAQEGAKLERIEAGLGKSTAGNRRILEQTKRMIMRSANRGIRAAEARGDTETARDIQEALDFRLDIEEQEEMPVSAQPVIRFNRQGQRIQ